MGPAQALSVSEQNVFIRCVSRIAHALCTGNEDIYDDEFEADEGAQELLGTCFGLGTWRPARSKCSRCQVYPPFPTVRWICFIFFATENGKNGT